MGIESVFVSQRLQHVVAAIERFAEVPLRKETGGVHGTGAKGQFLGYDQLSGIGLPERAHPLTGGAGRTVYRCYEVSGLGDRLALTAAAASPMRILAYHWGVAAFTPEPADPCHQPGQVVTDLTDGT